MATTHGWYWRTFTKACDTLCTMVSSVSCLQYTRKVYMLHSNRVRCTNYSLESVGITRVVWINSLLAGLSGNTHTCPIAGIMVSILTNESNQTIPVGINTRHETRLLAWHENQAQKVLFLKGETRNSLPNKTQKEHEQKACTKACTIRAWKYALPWGWITSSLCERAHVWASCLL